MTDTTSNTEAPEDIENPYAENTPLTWIFGNHSKTRIIAALLSESDRDLNISDIARIAGISRSAVYDNLNELQEWGVIVETRQIGSSTMYKINPESEVVPLIAEIEDRLLDQCYETEETDISPTPK